MRYFLSIFICGLVCFNMNAQDSTLPFHQIPEAPESYTAEHVVARMVDGLGYRYYWATEGLRVEDLAYEPGNDGQNVKAVLKHLYGLSLTIKNSVNSTPNIRPLPNEELPFEELRARTLKNLKAASDGFREMKKKGLKKSTVIFQRGERTSEFPFWNMLNGPIADAIYHTGQIVSYRRSSGNPINPKVNVFMGKTRE